MSLFKIFDISGSGMQAQNIRLNTTASNMANASSVASSADTAYKARQPVFAAVLENGINNQEKNTGVAILGIVESKAEHDKRYQPDHPLANAEGYIYESNVNTIEEMANMISASRNYQTNIEVLNTSKKLLQQTLKLGE